MRLFLATTALVAAALAAGAGTLTCPDPHFTVTAPDPATATRTCRAAAVAQSTLGACGLRVERPLAIEVGALLSSPDCLGLYHCGADRIEVLSPAALDAAIGDGPFTGVDRDRFWDSVVVHEVAHALYDRVPCPFEACVGTAEYVAYAVQVLSLPEADRRAFETGAGIAGRVTRDRLSGLVALMAPDRFAGLAWAHFTQRPDPCAYLRRIMDGNIHFDSDRP